MVPRNKVYEYKEVKTPVFRELPKDGDLITPLKIRIKYHTDEPVEIKDIEIGDWYDIPIQEDYILREHKLYDEIPLGVSMEIPEGYEAHLIVRSSTFKKYGFLQTNGMGIIDNSYAGNNDVWTLPIYRIMWGSLELLIKKGFRLCQFRIVPKQPKCKFVKVEDMMNEDRGGLGSTGK